MFYRSKILIFTTVYSMYIIIIRLRVIDINDVKNSKASIHYLFSFTRDL